MNTNIRIFAFLLFDLIRIYVIHKAIFTHKMSIIYSSQLMAVCICCAAKIAIQTKWMHKCSPANRNQINNNNNSHKATRLIISVIIITIHTIEIRDTLSEHGTILFFTSSFILISMGFGRRSFVLLHKRFNNNKWSLIIQSYIDIDNAYKAPTKPYIVNWKIIIEAKCICIKMKHVKKNERLFAFSGSCVRVQSVCVCV